MRIQVDQKKKMKKFEYIEAQYFEPCDSLDKEVRFILNSKLQQIKDLYERNLQKLQSTNAQLQH